MSVSGAAAQVVGALPDGTWVDQVTVLLVAMAALVAVHPDPVALENDQTEAQRRAQEVASWMLG